MVVRCSLVNENIGGGGPENLCDPIGLLCVSLVVVRGSQGHPGLSENSSTGLFAPQLVGSVNAGGWVP